MAAQPGREFALRINSSGATYVDVAGGRTKSLTLGDAMVDVTNSDSAGRWRELLAEAGVRQWSASLQGVFVDDAAFGLVSDAFFAGTIKNWKLIMPEYGTLTGAAQITQLEIAGEYNGAVNYTITLESADEPDFTAS